MPRYGCINDKDTSDVLKVAISQQRADGLHTVIGYLAEGSSKSLTANWESPFTGDTAGNVMEKVGGHAQALSSDYTDSGNAITSVTKLNSQRVWADNDMDLQLQVYFKAKQDAKLEVMDAIEQLEIMASPELAQKVPLDSRTPSPVRVNISGRHLYVGWVIQNVDSQLDAPRTREGHMLYNTVSLALGPPQTLNASEIPNTYT